MLYSKETANIKGLNFIYRCILAIGKALHLLVIFKGKSV